MYYTTQIGQILSQLNQFLSNNQMLLMTALLIGAYFLKRLVGSTAPATPAEGTLYFNSTDKHFYGWNGTAAGTVCQGNDARLSDARTPVAHAHGGADIIYYDSSWNIQNKTGLDLTINYSAMVRGNCNKP